MRIALTGKKVRFLVEIHFLDKALGVRSIFILLS